MGRVRAIRDAVIEVDGLAEAKVGCLLHRVSTAGPLVARVSELHRWGVRAELLRRHPPVEVGDEVEHSAAYATVIAGPDLAGRVIDPLGSPRDSSQVPEGRRVRIEARPPRFHQSGSTHRPLPTQVKPIDLLHPLRHGGTYLLSGAGGPALAREIALSQEGSGVHFIYAAIGSEARDRPAFEEAPTMRWTIVETGPSDPPLLRWLTPFAAVSLAEELRDQGLDSLVVVDDLARLAQAFEARSAWGAPLGLDAGLLSLFDRAGVGDAAAIALLALTPPPSDPLTRSVAAAADAQLRVLDQRWSEEERLELAPPPGHRRINVPGAQKHLRRLIFALETALAFEPCGQISALLAQRPGQRLSSREIAAIAALAVDPRLREVPLGAVAEVEDALRVGLDDRTDVGEAIDRALAQGLRSRR